jgi:hypothetical protein
MPRWAKVADEVDAVTLEVFGSRIRIETDNGTDVMALSFATKQHEHLRSVRVLIAAGLHRDALLVARTMLEGLARLLWAFNDVPGRTELWFWYGAILDWRQTLENEAKGMPSDPSDKAELKAYVDAHGPNYFRREVRNAIEAAEKSGTAFEMPQDPWRKNWTDVQHKAMFQEAGIDPMYEGVYAESSEWIHWGPRSILRAMEPATWGMSGFTQEDWAAALRALGIGCFSLVTSLQVLDQHLALGRTEQLASLMATLSEIFRESLASES